MGKKSIKEILDIRKTDRKKNAFDGHLSRLDIAKETSVSLERYTNRNITNQTAHFI